MPKDTPPKQRRSPANPQVNATDTSKDGKDAAGAKTAPSLLSRGSRPPNPSGRKVMPPDRVWKCPLCGAEITQPPTVTHVGHACPHRGGRLVELIPAEEDT